MTAIACPACRTAALKHYVDKTEGGGAFACDLCEGLWFDGNTLHEFLHSRRLKARFVVGDTSAPLESPGFNIDSERVKCPRCRVPLEEISYAAVVVDACKSCKGLWFSAGTLNHVIDAHDRHRAHNALIDEEFSQVSHLVPAAAGAEKAAGQREEQNSAPQHLEKPDLGRLKEVAREDLAVLRGVAGVAVTRVMDAVAHFLHHDHDVKR